MFGKKSAEAQNVEADLMASVQAGNRSQAENTRILGLVAQDYLKDRRSRRRWGWVIKGLVAIYIGAILYGWFTAQSPSAVSERHTAVVELSGVISPSEVSADLMAYSLRKAFKAKNAAGVVLRINSPGGTPVQAALINTEIGRLRALYPEKPFYVVLSDIAASGGYYVAVAADQIYAHPASLVGSIGVRMDSFGVVDAMQKLGIERRLITAGENKGMLDPFSPLQPEQKTHAEQMIGEVHQQFIDAVKAGRGDRLDTREELFGGLIWSGQRAKELGLVDEFGSVSDIARDVLNAERTVVYNPKGSVLEQLLQDFGVQISDRFFAKVFNQNLQMH